MRNETEIVARLPIDDHSGQDDYCSICGDDNVAIVITGHAEQINLCSKHFGIMKDNIRNLGNL